MTSTTSTRTVASQELLERCNTIRQLLATGNANCHAIGVQYNYIVDNQLAEKAGFKNAPEFLTQQIKDLSRSTIVSYGTVARSFTSDICAQYGVTALNLLLVYVEASGIELDSNEPGTLIIQVPDAHGQVEDKLFADCGVTDLRTALQRLRKPTSSTPLPPDVDARAQQCSTALTDFFPKNAGIRIEVRNRRGKAVLNLKDIPLEQMEQLTALLSAGLRQTRAA